MFFKYTCLGNAAGQLSKLLVIIAVKEMDDDTFYVKEVDGLAHTSETGCSGYIMFTKKRAGNEASNKWFHEFYLIPEISKADVVNQNLEFGGMKSAIYIDGESTILTAGMNPEILNKYRLNNINGVKGVPSGTSKHQAWDVSTSFMDIKTGVNKVARHNSDVASEILVNSLRSCFSTFHTSFPLVQISESFKKKIIYGCEVVIHVMQSGAISGPKIRLPFILNGQHCNDKPDFNMPGNEKTTINTRKIMSLCSSPISNVELLNFELHLPELVADCHLHGCTNDTLMDELELVKNDDHASRDLNVLWRRPPLIFTHTNQETQFTLWQLNRSPAEVTRRREQEAAQKLINRNATQVAVRAASKRKREEEIVRVSGLTKEQKKIEINNKKAATLLKKQNKELKERADLEQAQAIVGGGNNNNNDHNTESSDSDSNSSND